MIRTVFRGAAVLLAAALAGCNAQPPEERINDAVRLDRAVAEAHASLLAVAEAGGVPREPIEAEYARRLKVRALECAKGYAPGMFDEAADIAGALEAARPCFAAQDAAIAAWLAQRRVAVLLAAAPLRPVPPQVATFVAPGPITNVDFATRAGIGLVMGERGVAWIVDLGTGRILSTSNSAYFERDNPAGSLSPNGRLFVMRQPDGAAIQDAETGLPLMVVPGASATSVQWVQDVGILVGQRDPASGKRRAFFRDLATGLESSIDGELGTAMPIPGKQDRFLMVGLLNPTRELVLEHTPGGWKARVEGDYPPLSHASDPANSVTADGRTLTAARGPFLDIYDLATRQPRRVNVAPLRLFVTYPLADPDQVLLMGDYEASPARTYEWMVYSLSKGTAAVIERGVQQGYVAFVPSMHALVEIDGNRMRNAALTPTQAPADLAGVVAARALQMSGQAQATLETQRMSQAFAFAGAPPGAAARAIVPIQGPVLELAKKARVIGVGVYEGTRTPGASVGNARGGTVLVRVMRTKGPIILVLSAYEPVQWVVTADPGAEIGAVLLSGHSGGGEVMGTLAPLHRIGTAYHYPGSHGDEAALDTEVRRWTNKGLDRVEGKYRGELFIIRE